ncbi:hypothetical protein AB6D37_19640, partial [Pectobacterium brasiliense]|uniref:hypothetical protein n=1 Tax=Pectobacterium brasiliense TaxID=180957 RepID=UPI003985E6F8
DAQDGSCTLGLRHPWRKRFTLLFRYSRFSSANKFVDSQNRRGKGGFSFLLVTRDHSFSA